MARDYLDIFGRNLDAALDVGDPAERLTGRVKGLRPAEEHFRIFGGHDRLGSHREVGRYHVSVLDDHEMVGRAKRRFAAWSRIVYRTEVVNCLNTAGASASAAHVTIDAALHAGVSQLRVLYRGDWSDTQLKNPPAGETVPVSSIGGRRTVYVSLPPAGMLILAA